MFLFVSKSVQVLSVLEEHIVNLWEELVQTKFRMCVCMSICAYVQLCLYRFHVYVSVCVQVVVELDAREAGCKEALM